MDKFSLNILAIVFSISIFLIWGVGYAQTPVESEPDIDDAVIETSSEDQVDQETDQIVNQDTEISSVKADAPSKDAAAQDAIVSETGDEYNPEGKIDPFIPLFTGLKVKVPKEKEKRTRPLTPLERVDLSQLVLTATILAASGDRAMVVETGGKGYIVKVGTYIGINSGIVTKIEKDRIVVEEEVENIFGQKSVQERELKLQKAPGE